MIESKFYSFLLGFIKGLNKITVFLDIPSILFSLLPLTFLLYLTVCLIQNIYLNI
jgi:hypothetical protein